MMNPIIVSDKYIINLSHLIHAGIKETPDYRNITYQASIKDEIKLYKVLVLIFDNGDRVEIIEPEVINDVFNQCAFRGLQQ